MKKSANKLIIFSLVFLFPLFFLPITQEFFITNKFYLLAFGGLTLILISCINYLISKKISWISLPFDTPLIVFLLTLGLSIIFSSPNKVQAVLNPNFGLAIFVFLTLFYFFLSRQKKETQETNLGIFSFSTLILSLTSIIFFFQPFKNTNLPLNLQFLKNPYFTPMGSPLDLAIFLGFFLVLGLVKVIKENQISNKKNFLLDYLFLFVNLLAFSLTLYNIFNPSPATNNNQIAQNPLLLAPWTLSWYSAVEVLKRPLTALFGVGIDNFASIFTQVKDLAYNQSPLWQINSFSLSRSAFLHILTETGLFGLLAFLLILIAIFKSLKKVNNKVSLAMIVYSIIIILFFPPSLISWFLFFFSLAYLGSQLKNEEEKIYDLSSIMPLYLGVGLIWLALVGGSFYFLGRSYASELYFKKALDGFAQNNAKTVYDNIRQAIILNPYIERYRINFSQVNLLIANNIAAKAGQTQGKDGKPYELTENDRQNITQAIQAAINEAKAAVTLNPQKASNWENLAVVYRNIINTAQGADVWTISAYQRAIVLDPQNPIYRLNLGGTYYSLGNYEEAVRVFEQAVVLKPDWANAYYNLAWGEYQKGNYQKAVNALQNAISLLDPQRDKTDLERAQKELEEFKKKLPEEEKQATESAQPTKLSLPTPPPATLEPKIKLPETASPEAK